MGREFLINIILLVVINLIVKPLYIFGVEARVQDVVGVESYGLYFSLFNFVFLFQFINDPGLQTWNAQFVPKNRLIIGSHLGHLILTKLFLSVTFILAVWLVAFMVGYRDYNILILIAVNLILSSVFMLIRSSIAGLGLYKTDSLLSAADKFLMIIIIGYGVWFSPVQNEFGIRDFVLSQMMSVSLAVLTGGIILFKNAAFEWPSFNVAPVLKILKMTSPYILTMIFMTAYNKIDGVFLGFLLEDNGYQAGVYASAYRFYDAANMIGYLFAALLLPMFAAHMFDREILLELHSMGLRYATLAATVIVMILTFYGQTILKFLYSDYVPQFYITLNWLIFGYLAMAVGYIYGTLLVATGKVRHVNIVYALGLLVNIVLNLVFIPRYGAIGAAAATVVTQTVVLFGQILVVYRELNIIPLWSDVSKLLLYFLFSYIGLYFVKNQFETHWVSSVVISVLICLLLSFILKVVNYKELTALVTKKM